MFVIKRLLFALAASFVMLPVYGVAAEKTVDFLVDGQKVVGTLEIPDGVENPPVVLLLHGFTGSRNELEIPSVKEGIFARAARVWSAQGLASLRIDFRGGGDSDGKFPDTTVDGQIKDALSALDFVVAQQGINKDKIAIVGWSLGGAVATAVAARTDHPLKAVALWAPATNLPSSFNLLFGDQVMRAGLAGGEKPIIGKLPWGAEVSLKPAFFKSLFDVVPAAEMAKYHGPLLVAVGTKDTIVFPQPASGQILLDYHDGPEELWVSPMDHAFDVFVNTEKVDTLIAKTAEFIKTNTK